MAKCVADCILKYFGWNPIAEEEILHPQAFPTIAGRGFQCVNSDYSNLYFLKTRMI